MSVIVEGSAVVEWVAKKTNDFGNFGAAVGIGVSRDNQLIGGVVFNEYNGTNICIHAASNGNKYWLNREFLWYIFYYAFEIAKVKRVTAVIPDWRVGVVKFNEGIGFKYETRLQGASRDSGDLLFYRMWKHECRWLNTRRVKREPQQEELLEE